MRFTIFFLSFLLFTGWAYAQKVTLQGHVQDAETGETLPYVSIYAGEGKGTLTNDDGDFKLTADSGVVLRFSCVGYEKMTVKSTEQPFIVRLRPYSTVLGEVTIESVSKDRMLKQVIGNLKQDYQKYRKRARKYFFRTVTEMDGGYYIAEAFMKAYSVVNIRSAEIVSGLQGCDTEGRGETLNLASSNIHRLIEVAPVAYESKFWKNAIMPLASYSVLRKFYDTEVQYMQGEGGEPLYKIEFFWKKNLPAAVGLERNITGVAYVDGKDYRLLRFDGSCNNYTVSLGWLIPFDTTIKFHIEYDYSQGEASVANLAIHGSNSRMLYHALLFSIGQNEGKTDRLKASGSNIVTALRDAGFDVRLWEKYDIIKRTRDEERAAFGWMIPSSGSDDVIDVDTAQTDNAALRTLWQHLWQHSKMYAQEKVFVHMDNTSYCLGDTVWFAAYLRDTDRKEPLPGNNILNVELLNQEGFLVECKQVETVNGFGWGFFSLNEPGLYGGFYELRAYTRWQLNWGAYEREHSPAFASLFVNKEKESAFFRDYEKLYSRVFPVYDRQESESDFSRSMTLRPLMGHKQKQGKRKLAVQFYPEGGHLIAGMETQVAFEAAWDDGEWAEGTLHFGNETVQTFNRGRGRIRITPDTDTKQSLVFMAKDGTKTEASLSEVEKSGVAIHAEEKENAWDITVRMTDDLNPHHHGLSVMNEGKINYFRQIGKHAETFHIPFSSLRAGVNQATVFDNQGRVLADRLFFVWKEETGQPTLKIEGLRDSYQPYERIELNVCRLMADSMDTENLHFFSLAVRDKDRTDSVYDNTNILAEMLLASEIRGFVPNPAWYFQRNDAAHHDALDLLLMVQGWRRFSWVDMATDNTWQPSWPKEHSVMLTGDVYGISQSKKDITEVSDISWVLHTETVDLSNMKHTHSYNVLYGDGHFAVSLPHGYTEYLVFMDILKKKPDKNIKKWKDRSVVDFISVKDSRQRKKVRKNTSISDEQKPCIRLDKPSPRNVQPYSYYQCHLPKREVLQKQRSFTGFKDTNPTLVVSSNDVAYAVDDLGLVSDALGKGTVAVLMLNDLCEDLTVRRGINRFRRSYENMHRIPADSIYLPKNLRSYPMSFRFDDNELEEYEGKGSIEKYVLYTDANLRTPNSSHTAPLTIVEYPYPDGFKRTMPASRTFQMSGLSPCAKFYHPDYSQQRLPKEEKDYRRTLYWAPCLMLDEKGQTHILFYNNSRITHLSVEAEGMDSNGTLLWGEVE